MKNLLIFLFLGITLATQAASSEIWAYLMKGEEKYFPTQSPITDVACFSAAIDGDGNLKGGHLAPPTLKTLSRNLRYHLVITIPWNQTLAHIYMNPDLPFRDHIIQQITERAHSFDGVQIDIESVHKDDGTAYLNFLAAVKKALPKDKIFSVAVMARWAEHKAKNPTDAFDYPFINRIADRVIVMAYDEHYRSGPAGPIASLPWCHKIYQYAQQTISPQKLIMGVPLYGRGWQNPKALAHSYKNNAIEEELKQKRIRPTYTQEGGFYSFSESVTISVYYETIGSLNKKINLYQSKPMRGLAFWRIGQEPARFWGSFRP